jgi:hypothetical protein
MRSRHRWRRVARAHRPMGQPCTIVWCMLGCLDGLGGGPSCEHGLPGGVAMRSVWGLGGIVMRVSGPPKICDSYSYIYI